MHPRARRNCRMSIQSIPGSDSPEHSYIPTSRIASFPSLPKGRRDFFASSNGDTDMGNSHGRFVWYELMTTDMKTAKLFYANVVGWGARDAFTAGLGYSLFTVADLPVAGLMSMPEDGQKTGAPSHWIGYVG